MNEQQPPSQILLYQSADGSTRVDVRMQNESAWLSLNQMAELFQRDKSIISRHLKTIFESVELYRDSVVAVFATTAPDAKTYQVECYKTRRQGVFTTN